MEVLLKNSGKGTICLVNKATAIEINCGIRKNTRVAAGSYENNNCAVHNFNFIWT